MADRDRSRHPFALAATVVLLTAGIVALLMASEPSGTGAVNVGDRGVSEPPARGRSRT